jgi:hypothetical protein
MAIVTKIPATMTTNFGYLTKNPRMYSQVTRSDTAVSQKILSVAIPTNLAHFCQNLFLNFLTPVLVLKTRISEIGSPVRSRNVVHGSTGLSRWGRVTLAHVQRSEGRCAPIIVRFAHRASPSSGSPWQCAARHFGQLVSCCCWSC